MSAAAAWDGVDRAARAVIEAEATVPTRHGPMRFLVVRWGTERDHVVLVRGDVRGADVLVRIHAECMTSEVFGSLDCDCARQLDGAMARIAAEGRGVVLYLRQERRGIGRANDVHDRVLQGNGAGTADVHRASGPPEDARRYAAAAAILRTLGVRSVRLLTNDVAKLDALEALGVDVTC